MSLNTEVSFTDKSFDSNKSSQYHLSLQVFLKGFSFCVLDRDRNRFIALGHFNFPKITSYSKLLSKIEEIFSNNFVLNLKYEHVKLIVATPKFAFIPSPFYKEDQAHKVYGFTHDLMQSEELNTNFIFGTSSYVVFAISKNVKSFFKEKFGDIKLYHQSSPLVEEIMLKNKLVETNKTVFINVYPDFFDIAVVENGKLVIYNSFVCTSNTDFQYFVLNTFDKLKLSQIDTPVAITGFIETNDERIEYLKSFVKQVTYLGVPSHFEYSYGFNEVPNYAFTNLINLYQCG